MFAITEKRDLARIRIKKRRLTWNASVSPDALGYKIYWSKVGRADYDSDYAEVGNALRIAVRNKKIVD